MQWTPILGKTDYIDVDWSLAAAYHLNSTELVLIDSGAEPSSGLLAALDDRGLRVRAILCTHPHHDHIANNPALYERYHCEIFVSEDGLASAAESGYPLYPAVSGLSAPPLIPIPQDASYLDIDGARFRLIPTPGHMPGHIAIVTPDGVCALGDAVVSPEILPMFKLPYMTNVDQSLASMEKLRQTRYPFYLTAHKGLTPLSGLQDLIDQNVKKELDIYSILRHQITGPTPVDELLTHFLTALHISPSKQRSPWILETSMDRVHGLVHAGEIALLDGVVYPIRSA